MQTQETFGILGLGAMGQGISYRLRAAGIQVHGFDTNPLSCLEAQKMGVHISNSLEQLASTCSIIWLMIPSGQAVTTTISQLSKVMHPNSVIINGGNSNFHDSIKHAQELSQHAINFLDCGTSGGLAARDNGYCCMVGGEQSIFNRCEYIFKALATQNGYLYTGPTGSGHYVKMVHNGIEYALLQAYAEGFQVLKEGEYKNLNLPAIANLWNNGSIIRSYILELMYKVLQENSDLTNTSGKVDFTGMGQWTVEEAKAKNIPVPLIENALRIRQESQETGGTTATKFVALLRHAFGGHKVHKQ